jgi:hypothetical protein
MKNAVFWDVMTSGSCKNRRFIIRVITIGKLGTLAITSNSHYAFLRSVLRLLITVNVVPSSSIVTLMVEAIRSSEM